MTRRLGRPRSWPVLVSGLALTLSACGGGSSGPSTSADGVQTGVGVDGHSITLGILTDRSGVIRDLGRNIVQGHELWAEEVNAAGGVCNRQVRFELRDHGYKAETAKTHFPDIESRSLGFLHILGSPMVAATAADITEEEVTTGSASFSSDLLDNPYLLRTNTTYDLETINGLAHLLKEGDISPGDTIGHIYVEGEYGSNALKGSRYFAERHRLQLKDVKITPSDADMTGIVTGLKGAGVTAIVLSTVAAQTASATAASAALGMNVPLVANSPGYLPTLMTTPAAGVLADRLLVMSGVAPLSADDPAVTKLARRHEAAYPEEDANWGVVYGFALGRIWGDVLTRACANRDLTRQGVQAALADTDRISTDGLLPELDLSTAGAFPSRESYILKPDRDARGGLRLLKALHASEDARAFPSPAGDGAAAG